MQLRRQSQQIALIEIAGVLRGAQDTLIPSLLNLGSLWGIRIMLAIFFVDQYGLCGAWAAMCAEP